MAMTRAQAHEYLLLHAAAEVEPTLSTEERDACIDQALIIDADGYTIDDALYTETVWGTRAVVLALDAKIAKASSRFDFTADGSSFARSQVVTNLERLRSSWRSRMIAGSV